MAGLDWRKYSMEPMYMGFLLNEEIKTGTSMFPLNPVVMPIHFGKLNSVKFVRDVLPQESKDLVWMDIFECLFSCLKFEKKI